MTELEKIEYTKSFIDKLANGINPLDNSPIPETDIVNNVRLSRCFFYVSDILRQVIENGGTKPNRSKKQHKNEFRLNEVELSKIQLSEMPISVSEITKQLNGLINPETTKKISAATIKNWLLEIEMLKVVALPNGKSRKVPTSNGNAIGIFSEERTGMYGVYTVVLFSPQAQQFIYDNLDSVIDSKNESHSEFQGRSWTEEHDDSLIDMFNKGVPVREIAATLKRTETGIRARLKKIGLIENRSDAK